MSSPPQAKRPVTRADVARLAGVSPAVVSYVLNGTDRPVSPATRTRVEDAIAALRYRPNAIARALRQGTTRTVGLLIPDSSNPLFAELSQEIEAVADAAGYAIILTNARGDVQHEAQQLRNLVDRQVDGLIVISASTVDPYVDQLQAMGLPIVVMDRVGPLPGITTVGVDFELGSSIAVEHMLSHGHRLVAAVLGDDGSPSTIARERGWAGALQAAKAQEGPTVRVPFSRQGGYEAGLNLLSRPAPPAAVFISSDLQAVGFLRAAHEIGVAVPEQTAVISFDGSLECQFTWPALSVVEQPLTELAHLAMSALLEGEAGAHTVVQPRLIARASCGCPPTQ